MACLSKTQTQTQTQQTLKFRTPIEELLDDFIPLRDDKASRKEWRVACRLVRKWLSPHFQGLFDNVGLNAAQTISETAKQLPSLIATSLNDILRNFIPDFQDSMLTQITDLVSSLYVLWRSRDRWDVCAAVIVAFASRHSVTISQCDISFLSKYLPSVFHFQNVVDTGADNTFNNISKILASFGGMFMFLIAIVLQKGIPTSFEKMFDMFSTNVLDITSKMGHSIRGIESCTEFIKKYSAKISQFFTWMITGEMVPTPNEKNMAKFQELIDKMRKFESITVQHDMILDRKIINELEAVVSEAEDFLLALKNDQKNNDFDIITFRSIVTNLRRIHARMIDVADSRSKSRTEPLCVMVSGLPGVGKSFVTDQLVCYLAKQHNELVDKYEKGTRYDIDVENMNSMKYTFNPANDFWDGYKAQFATIMDDFGQVVDSAAKPNPEFIELIRCVNCSEYALHSASLAEKGKIKFDSRFIMLSSNKLSHAVLSINSKAALYRRMHLIAHMKVKSQYAKETGALDVSKIDGSNDYYEFDIYDNMSLHGLSTCPPRVIETLSFAEFVSKCSEVYYWNYVKSQNNVMLLDKAVATLPPPKLQIADDDFSDAQDSFYDLVKEALTSDASKTDKLYALYYLSQSGASKACESLKSYATCEKLWQTMQDHHLLWKAFFGAIAIFIIPKLLSWFKSKGPCKNCSAYLSSKQDTKSFIKYLNNLKKDCRTCEETLSKLKECKIQSDSYRSLICGSLEMCKDENTFSLANKICRQMFSVQNMQGNHKFTTAIIRGRVVLINRHCAEWMRKQECVLLQRHGFTDAQKIYVKSCSFVFPDDRTEDYALCVLPTNVVGGRDLVSSFVTSLELGKFDEVEATLVALNRPSKGDFVSSSMRSGHIKASDKIIDVSEGDVIHKVRTGYEYEDISTLDGDCGSLLLINSKLVSRKICALHAYGSPIVNGGVSITQPKLEALLKSVPQNAQISMFEPENIIEDDSQIKHLNEALPNLIPFGSAKPVFAPTKTDIQKSPLYGCITGWEPTMSPSKLVDKNDPPLTKGLKKVANVPLPVEPDLLKKCADHYFDNLNPNKSNLNRVLSDTEMIEGIRGEEFQPICRSSSPGYPYVLNNPGKGKKPWLGEGEAYEYKQELKDKVENRLSQAKKGIRTETIWVDTLKDERRPIEKVNANKTRVFSYAPLDYVLAVRKYFGGFAAFMHKNRVTAESCVGIDPYSEWWRIANRLEQVGDNIVAGDFSNFDGSILLDVLSIICEKIQQWYGDDSALLRETLYAEINQSVHLANGVVYGWTHSNPSGNPLTVIVNSVFNSIMCRVVFCHATGLGLDMYDKHVRAVNYGDDNVLSISTAILPLFNQITMTKAFAHFGLTYTDEAKTGNIVSHRSISEVAFLKRGFVKRDGQWLAPLQIAVIMEMVQWLRKSVDRKNDCATIVEKALSELSLHPTEQFDKLSKVILDACQQQGIKPKKYCQSDLVLKLSSAKVDLSEYVRTHDSSFAGEQPHFQVQADLESVNSWSNKTTKEMATPKAEKLETFSLKENTDNLLTNSVASAPRTEKKFVSLSWILSTIRKEYENKDEVFQATFSIFDKYHIDIMGNPTWTSNEMVHSLVADMYMSEIRDLLDESGAVKVTESIWLDTFKLRADKWKSSKSILDLSATNLSGLSKSGDVSTSAVRRIVESAFCAAVGKKVSEISKSGDASTSAVRRVVESAEEVVMVQPVPLSTLLLTAAKQYLKQLFLFKTACSFNAIVSQAVITAYLVFKGMPEDQVRVAAECLWVHYAHLISPFVEELVYQVDPTSKAAFAFQELIIKITNHGFQWCMIPVVFMHIATSFMPFFQRLVLHTCWNLGVHALWGMPLDIKVVNGKVLLSGTELDLSSIEACNSCIISTLPVKSGCVAAGAGTDSTSDDAIPTYHEVLGDSSEGSQLMQHGQNEPEVKVADVTIPQSISTIYNDVKSSLEREVIVASGNWSDSDVPMTVLETLQFPKVLFDKNPFFVNRTSYFAYMKANISVSILVNGTKFSCGQLYFAFSQAGEEAGTMNGCTSFMRGITCLPGVRIKAQTGATGTLEIPYCYPTKGFGMNSGEGTFGTGYVVVTNVLRGLPSCGYTITAKFVNPQLSVQDSSVTIYQTSRPRLLAGVGSEETTASNKGFFSKVLSIAKPVTKVLEEIPVIGPIASTVGKVFDIFGFDKPNDLRAYQPIAQMPAKNWTHWSNIDGGVILGQTGESEAGYEPNLGLIPGDEMSLEHCCGQSALMYTIPWKNSDPADTIIKHIKVTCFDEAFSTASGQKYIETDLIGYIANFFSFWRGNMIYEFDPISAFTQSGKLRIAVGPPTRAFPTTATELNNLPNFILDLQATDPIVQIPASFMANAQWLPVSGGIFSCHIYVGVVNPLVSSSPDITEIDVNVWRFADSSLQFSAPTDLRNLPSFQMRPERSEIRFEPFEDAFGDRAVCERLYSLREVVKRNCPAQSLVLSPKCEYSFDAQAFGKRKSSLSYFAPLFRYFRGGKRFKISCDRNEGELRAVLSYGPYEDDGFRAYAERPTLAQYRTNCAVNPYLEITVPWYYIYPMGLVQPTAQSTTLDDAQVRPHLIISYSNPTQVDSPAFSGVTTTVNGDLFDAQVFFTSRWTRYEPSNVVTSDMEIGDAITIDNTIIIVKTTAGYDYSPFDAAPGQHAITFSGGTKVQLSYTYQEYDGVMPNEAQVSVWESAGDDFSFHWLLGPQKLKVPSVV